VESERVVLVTPGDFVDDVWWHRHRYQTF